MSLDIFYSVCDVIASQNIGDLKKCHGDEIGMLLMSYRDVGT
jgi:hypothetical protein